MINYFKNYKLSKRERLTYVIILSWLYMAILSLCYEILFTDLSAYFISLIGFISIYIFGESKRKSENTPLFKKGKSNSKRELITYIIVFLWLIIGTLTICNNGNLIDLSSYFAALTPFVGGYIIAETYRKTNVSIESDEIVQINS